MSQIDASDSTLNQGCRPVASLPTETLTSHLRSVFRILSFKFRLDRPFPNQVLELPRVTLEIENWEVHSGDRNDPVFHDTQEVGRGPKDGEVQRVLRKWWFGEWVDARYQVVSLICIDRRPILISLEEMLRQVFLKFGR